MEATYPQIISVEQRKGERPSYVVLGREDAALDSFFTRIADDEGNQYWGHYRMSLGEAFADFENRKNGWALLTPKALKEYIKRNGADR